MDNETNTIETTAKLTVEDLRTAREAAETATLAYEATLRQFAKDNGSTYQEDGKFFQIRHRETSSLGREYTYVCALKEDPALRKGVKKTKTGGAVTTEAVEEQLPMAAMAAGVTDTTIE